MVALAAFIKYSGKDPLGGVFGLSGLQALKNIGEQSDEKLVNMRNTPLFLWHGDRDHVIPDKFAKVTYEYFKDLYL